jgi:peptidoglycan/LPS O-acetylase OafA/YrhL
LAACFGTFSVAAPLENLFAFGGTAGVAFFFVLSGFILHHVHHQDLNRPASAALPVEAADPHLSNGVIAAMLPKTFASVCVAFVLMVVICAAVSAAFYTFIERPMLRRLMSSKRAEPTEAFAGR